MARRFKFAGETCAYCATQPATTVDHVFSREFFLVKRRAHLPQVPACNPCNNAKSKLEHYLTAVLPFGGRHTDSTENLTNLVPRRLEKNHALHRRLAAGHARQDTPAGQAMTVPFDSEKLTVLFEYIAKGLAWHHWRELIAPTSAVWAGLLAGPGQALFDGLFAHRAKARVSEDLGGGTFAYEGAQSAATPQMTIWRFTLYGGAMFSGDPDAPEERSSVIGAMTGSKLVIDKFAAMARG
jgi:hypothetical protein